MNKNQSAIIREQEIPSGIVEFGTFGGGINPISAFQLGRFSLRENNKRWVSLMKKSCKTMDDGGGAPAENGDKIHHKKSACINWERDSFLSQISHDMRTPIHEISGLAEVTQGMEGLPPEAARNLETIKNSCDYLVGIVNDILSASRMESRGVEIEKRPISERAFLNKILPMIRCRAGMAEITLSEKMTGEMDRSILMDDKHVMRVLINLLTNAVKYTPSGGKVDFKVQVSDAEDGRIRHTYVIADSGQGMSASFQKRMYDAFEQEKDKHTVEKEGTGLGLYIVKQYVDAMGGCIRCDSEVGRGTTFIVTMDYELLAQPAPAVEKDGCKDCILSGKRVLICDDRPLNIKIASKMLERVGMEVDTASNGREAIDAFLASSPGFYDAILMDIRMPEMDGIEATRTLRSLDRADARRVPVIAMSADAYETNRQAGLAVGMDDYLTKPISMEHLYQVMAGQIGKNVEKIK